MSELAVSAHGLERRFGRVDAVAGVDLAIRRGEVYGFLGPNGAGKSTVVRMLCTLLLPSGGSATVAGYDLVREAQKVRLRIGAALQEASLDERQTGFELLRVQARLYGLRGADVKRRVESVCELIELDEALSRRIGTYSGGMRRRLDLATALIHEPEILFLDEPTTGLDPASRVRVWDEVQRLNRETGTTIFLTTQYLEEADKLAGRVGIIDHGRIVGEGRPADLKRSVGRDLIVVRVDRPDGAVAALAGVDLVESAASHGEEVTASVANGPAAVTPVALALERAGVQVSELSLRQPTLDDVFLELTGARLQTGEPGENEATDAPEPPDRSAGTAAHASAAALGVERGTDSEDPGTRRGAVGRRLAVLAWVLIVAGAIGVYAWLNDPLAISDVDDGDAPAEVSRPPDGPAPASDGAASQTAAPEAAAPQDIAPRDARPSSPAAASPVELVIAGTAPNGSWVQVREGDAFGPIVFEGTFAPEVTESISVAEPLWMRVGNTNGIDLSLGGEAEEVSGGTANFLVSADGIEPEAPAAPAGGP